MKRWALAAALLSLVGTGCAGGAVGSGADDPDVAEPTGTARVHEADDHDRDGPRRPRRPRGSEGWRLGRPVTPGEIEGFTTRSVVLQARGSVSRSRQVPGRSGCRRTGSVGTTGATACSSGPRLASRGTAGGAARSRRTPPGRSSRGGGAPHHRHDGLGARLLPVQAPDAVGLARTSPYVVSSPSAAGTVALVAPFTTYQAYNQWGGYSLYHGPDGDRRSWAVSFDRP